MPLYEYYCHTCSHRFIVFVQLDERGIPTSPPPRCPKCLDLDTEKQWSVPSMVDVKP